VAGVSSCHSTGCRQEETPDGTEIKELKCQNSNVKTTTQNLKAKKPLSL
jgi:hypothetical protein